MTTLLLFGRIVLLALRWTVFLPLAAMIALLMLAAWTLTLFAVIVNPEPVRVIDYVPEDWQ